ncbi:MAG: FTR1 family iron permease, partial [Acidimicrobiia bacterium]
VLAYLLRLNRRSDFRWVWLGTGCAIVVSLVAGAIAFALIGGLEGRAEKITEGVVAFGAAGVLTWMIFWMARQARKIKGELQAKVDQAIAQGSIFALASIAFIAVLREGLESALFLISSTVGEESNGGRLLGGLVGVLGAAAIGYLVYKGSSRVNLRTFFRVTGFLIVLFAAGLLAKGIHEFQEAHILGTMSEHLWDLSGIALLNPKASFVGELLKGLFGWSPSPSFEMAIVYLGFLLPVGVTYLGLTRKVPTVRQAVPAEAAAR